MKHHRFPWFITLLSSLLLCPAGALADGPPQGRPALVVVGPVVQREVRPQVNLTGTAEPHRLITVASRVEELVEQVMVEEGQRVKAGQALVRLDRRHLKLRLGEATAALAESTAGLEQLERDLVRKQALYEKKSVPLKSLEDARTAVTRQKAVAQRNRESMELLRLQVRDAVIASPADGVVVARLVNQGEWVKKGGPIIKLSVLDPIKVLVRVPERFLPHITLGQEVCCTADANPGKTYCGDIFAIIPSGDPDSRTFPVQIRVSNPGGRLMPGMLMRVNLGVGARRPAILAPKDALVVSTDGQSVFVVHEGKAEMVPVKVGGSFGGRVEVTGDLKPGQSVVVTGNERLRPGQPVKIVKPDSATPPAPQPVKQ